ncbi:MAG: hypothetical protein HYY12_06235 [Candidatus Methylomirabilis oxyfera]|nr:hypothetical protein [Candidatus Methylomirabilis oxyfera]
MCRNIGLLALFVAVVIGCGVGRPVFAVPPPSITDEDIIHQDLPGLVRAAPLIVVGRVVDIKPGRTAGSGEGKLQFNDVRVTVEKRLKGEPPAALIVEQVDMTGRVFIGLGPAYKTGERYVLFLRRGEGDRHLTIPQGRYLLRWWGVVRPTETGPVADKVKGTGESKFVEEIAAIVRRGS